MLIAPKGKFYVIHVKDGDNRLLDIEPEGPVYEPMNCTFSYSICENTSDASVQVRRGELEVSTVDSFEG